LNFRSFGTWLVAGLVGTEKMVSAGKRVAGAAGLGVLLLSVGAGSASAQSQRRTRRESNANRKARIARTVEDTYTHKWEVGAGGGFLRFRSGEYKQQNNEVTFWGSALYALTPKLGVVGMAGGAFGSAKLNNTTVNAVNPQIQNFDFMAGPSYRFVSKEKYSVSVYGAGGAGSGRFSTGPKDFPPSVVGLWNSGTVAAFGAGLNLDYNFYPNLAVRVTPNYLGTTYSGADGSSIQNSKGVNFGVLYRFGRLR
jgi:hypothetical protein